MKTYTKPMIEITSYEAEKIMLLSGNVQNDFSKSTIQFSNINFN